LLTESPLTAA